MRFLLECALEIAGVLAFRLFFGLGAIGLLSLSSCLGD